MQQYLDLAQSTGLWLSLGGFQEYCPSDPQRLQNCHAIVNSSGRIVSTYRKVHLFDVEVFNGPVLKETTFTVPGDEVTAHVMLWQYVLAFALAQSMHTLWCVSGCKFGRHCSRHVQVYVRVCLHVRPE